MLTQKLWKRRNCTHSCDILWGMQKQIGFTFLFRLYRYQGKLDPKKDWKTMIKDVSDFGILVPCPECINWKEETRYFYVTKNWHTLISGEKLDIEMLPKAFIDTLINKVDWNNNHSMIWRILFI